MENQVSNVAVFMLVCLVFAMSSAFPIMSWMNRLGGVDPCNLPANVQTRSQIKASPVSIYLLQRSYPPDGSLPDPFITLSNPAANLTAGISDLSVAIVHRENNVDFLQQCRLEQNQCQKPYFQ